MLHVIASIHFEPSRESELRAIYADFVPQVQAEPGCLQYVPTAHFSLDLPNQEMRAGEFLVTEIWETEAAFRAHLQAPHVMAFREAIKGIVTRVSIRASRPLL